MRKDCLFADLPDFSTTPKATDTSEDVAKQEAAEQEAAGITHIVESMMDATSQEINSKTTLPEKLKVAESRLQEATISAGNNKDSAGRETANSIMYSTVASRIEVMANEIKEQIKQDKVN